MSFDVCAEFEQPLDFGHIEITESFLVMLDIHHQSELDE